MTLRWMSAPEETWISEMEREMLEDDQRKRAAKLITSRVVRPRKEHLRRLFLIKSFKPVESVGKP